MKKSALLLVFVLVFSVLAACGKSNKDGGSASSPAASSPAATESASPSASGNTDFKVGMVTDSGTIDDKSFNQGTWEGVQRATKDLGLKEKYLKPAGTTEADYIKEIGNLYDAGYKFIVTPGFKFETAIFAAQDKYQDAKFVLIDGAPHKADDFTAVVKPNTVSIFFAEHESGFLAGIATALQIKEGEAGFIGGMEIPPVQKYNWGFQQGLKYANDNLGTKVTIKKDNVVYQGTFSDVAAGQQIAAQMFDRGVKVIFAAAGGVGVGAIKEAKTRGEAGKDVWIVGVDVDQYADGMKKDGKSIILTSAMKKIDQAAYDMIKAETEGKFPGGQTLTFDSKTDGVGIPAENPNLSPETVTKVNEVFDKLKSGEIKVAGEQGDLIK
ncbi:BMP family ABC transporter substrate-binding protein [Cohnella pontilimi]|uniref:BMP family ABC transporter substrate-binding protein n=1 Tax=Cohnella pontilimi TaxID=2564100 RepID=A0A4U0F9S7_9BACL|nr:BMP family ABC transporter substrate-binding protein [Cohnella pontilimi]TJY41391.1 BMP family ABC transporter substrate-binding protein [Cohnella pontilimi]